MPTVSKTMGPIHFEDLDPHRFEDLIRQLIYDWKDWQSIEATGRGGSDEGFDIRAWERTKEITNKDEEDETSEGVHPMEGNLWMIQGKREKELGPSEVKKIITNTVLEKSPPYGYILIAPVNFTKKSYDIFREELRKKGVMEFYLWGRAELEDMLHQPKNDHILFTFIGVSLVARKRSRTTEVKFAINNKNKLLRVLGEGNNNADMFKSVLLRDFNDGKYPWEEKYKDFDKKPRWAEHIVKNFHPYGIMVSISKRYAYIDTEKKEWDFTRVVDLINRETERERSQDDQEYNKNRDKVEDFWKHLPRRNQATLSNKGIVLFDDMLIIDDKGDVIFNFPHIFVDFQYDEGPFKAKWSYLKGDGQVIELGEDDGYKKISIFPQVFPKIKRGKVYEDKFVDFDNETWRLLRIGSSVIKSSFFDIDGKYTFLNPRDVIGVAGVDIKTEQSLLEITNKYKTTVREYIQKMGKEERVNLERQIGRVMKDKEKLNVYEFERKYDWAVKR